MARALVDDHRSNSSSNSDGGVDEVGELFIIFIDRLSDSIRDKVIPILYSIANKLRIQYLLLSKHIFPE